MKKLALLSLAVALCASAVSAADAPSPAVLTIALTGGINTTAASLWMTASAANVVEVQLAA